MLSSETETSSAGEQLARDKLDERQKTKERQISLCFLEFFMPKKTHIKY